jgi:glucose-6-phosphate isomerase
MAGRGKVSDWIRYDFNNLMAESIGPHGVTEDELGILHGVVASYHKELEAERAAGKLGFYDLPRDEKTVAEVEKFASRAREKYDDFVVLGISGSALGPTAVETALNHPFYNLLAREKRGGPRFHVVDNVDPVVFAKLLETVDPAKTLFNVITKSGATAETVAQFLVVYDLIVRKLGLKAKDHVVATTEAQNAKGSNDLRTIADREGLPSFEVPKNVGGRFSVLSPVGLLPAAMTGVDVRAMLAGAACMEERTRAGDLWNNPAYAAAALLRILDERGKHLAVMMPYASQLRDVGDWFRQLWAESLGKKLSVDGAVVHKGPTPVNALGVTDQHSQLQLYAEGPFDKVVTFLALDRFDAALPLPGAFEDLKHVGYLAGRTMNELIESERVATQTVLTDLGRPNATIYLPRLDAHALGQLFFMLEVQTAMAGKLLRVNPFDQPGVEEGKLRTFGLMGMSGYEEVGRKMRDRKKPNSRYIIA